MNSFPRLALTLSMLLTVGYPVITLPAQAQTAQGYELLNKGWVNDAIASFQTALKTNPQDLSAKLGLARSFQKAGKLDQAWSTYQKALTQDQSNKEALLALGMLGEYKGSWQSSGIDALTQLLKLDASNRPALAQRALLLGYQSEFDRSLSDYSLLLTDKPSLAILIDAAKINTYAGNSSAALELFDRAKAGGAKFDDYTLAAYTTALTKTGRAADADRLLSDRLSANRLNPTGIDPAAELELRKARAIALGTLGKIEEGLSVLLSQTSQPSVQLVFNQPTAQALSELARLLGRSDLYNQAIAQYRALLQTNPPLALQIEAADVMSEQSSTRSSALDLYRKIAPSVPPDHPVLIKLEILAYRLGQRTAPELTQFLTKKITPTPDSRANRSIAQALIAIDPPDAALMPIYQSVARPTQGFLYYRIAQLHLQANKFDDARSALAQYQSTPQGSQDIAPALLLASIEQRSGNLDASAKAFEAIALASDRPTTQKSALRGLAGVRVQQAKLPEALTVYDRILLIDPTDSSATLGRARLAMLTRQLKVVDAEKVLNTWLETNPKSTPPSEFFDLLGDLPLDPSRTALYSQLLKLNPSDLKLQRRSLELLAKRDPTAARSQLAEFMTGSNGDINAYYLQGEVARSLLDLDLAATAYTAILTQQPDNVDALTALGGVRFEQERYAEAGTIYARAIALRPNDWSLRRTIADLSLAQDEPFKALEQLKLVQSLQRQQGITDEVTDYRIAQIEIDRLKRRSFQPNWEGYSSLKRK